MRSNGDLSNKPSLTGLLHDHKLLLRASQPALSINKLEAQNKFFTQQKLKDHKNQKHTSASIRDCISELGRSFM